jgi:hypothetical protein
MPCGLVPLGKTPARVDADEARPHCGRVELALFNELLGRGSSGIVLLGIYYLISEREDTNKWWMNSRRQAVPGSAD